MALADIICPILDSVGWGRFFSPCVMQPLDGLGNVGISADTAPDGPTPGATNLIAASGINGLSFSMPSYNRMKKDRRIVILPPEGFRFVEPKPSVVVGGGRRYGTSGPSTLDPIDGFALINSAGHVIWVAEEDPTQWHNAAGRFFVTVGSQSPLLAQPITGSAATPAYGQITVESDATLVSSDTLDHGVGLLNRKPGDLSISGSSVEVEPNVMRADGDEVTVITTRIVDSFGNGMDRMVSIVRSPEIGTLSNDTRIDTGVFREELRSSDPGDVAISSDVSGVLIPGPTLTIQAVDLSLSISADNGEPALGSGVTLTLRVTNAGPAAAYAVEVSYPVPSELEFLNALVIDGAGAIGLDGDAVRWTVPELAAGSSTAADVLLTVTGAAGRAISNTARIVASPVHDIKGAHTGSGDSASIDLFP